MFLRPHSVPTSKALLILAATAMLGVLALPSAAQQAPVATTQPRPPAKKAQPTAKADTQAPAATGESQLRQRIEQLEEQLTDIQVALGTLQSFQSAAPRAAAGGTAIAGGGADDARISVLETQIRALSAQVEQLGAENRALRSGLGAAPGRRSDVEVQQAPPAGGLRSGFGSLTVTPGESADPIGRLLGAGQASADAAGSGRTSAVPAAATTAVATPAATAPPSVAPSAASQALYDRAYAFLLQQDYGAAEAAFSDFLAQHPNDRQSGNAQYWLGEVYFVKGDYKQAAQAFLKGYQTYTTSTKAPDSLLKLALSLDRLGQKDGACTSFGELATRFPTAPAHIRSRAQSERQRLRC